MRAFPVIYARDVQGVTRFYEALGFIERFRLAPEGEPGFITLKRDQAELGVTTVESPRQLAGLELGTGPRFEMFIYVEDVDRVRGERMTIFTEPFDAPWGERPACVSDPDGNPVGLAMPGGR